MKRLVLSVLFTLLVASLSLAQGTATPAAAPAAPADTAQPNTIHGVSPITPVKGLDSKKLKEGDAIVCTTIAPVRLGSGMLIPTGAKVFGHITVAKARSKGDPDSSLAMTFDKIQVSSSREIDMKGTLLAVAPKLGGNTGPDTERAVPAPCPDTAAKPSPLPAPTPPSTAPTPAIIRSAAVAFPIPVPDLAVARRGRLSRNMQMGKDSVLTSTDKELKLDAGRPDVDSGRNGASVTVGPTGSPCDVSSGPERHFAPG